MPTIQLTLVDDHELIRDGLGLFLGLQPDIEVIAKCASPKELHQVLNRQLPDIILMDISLPQQSGIDLTKQLLKEYPKLKVVFLTGNEGEQYLKQAIKAGGKGFVPKSAPKTEVLKAVREVAAGKMYFPDGVSQMLFQELVGLLQHQNHSQELTTRELDVLRCFANGLSYKEVEARLSISKKNIENHKKAIFDKLGFHSNADLVKYAIKHHIIEIN